MPVFAPRSLSSKELLDRYFLENRARLLEIAAFLDRLDRAEKDADPPDYRCRAFRHALERLSQETGGRTRDLQILFSDPTSEPLASAGDLKSASGAWPGVVR